MTKDEALKLSLEALKRATNYDPLIARAITVIKKALAQPEQEPTNIERHEANVQKFLGAPQTKQETEAWHEIVLNQKQFLDKMELLLAKTAAPPQPEQEPVGEVVNATDKAFECKFVKILPIGTKLYTTPPQRTWVGLTGEEVMDATRKEGHELLDYIYEYGTGVEGVEERIVAICKSIEAKLKQKNGYAEEKNT